MIPIKKKPAKKGATHIDIEKSSPIRKIAGPLRRPKISIIFFLGNLSANVPLTGLVIRNPRANKEAIIPAVIRVKPFDSKIEGSHRLNESNVPITINMSPLRIQVSFCFSIVKKLSLKGIDEFFSSF